MFEIEIKHINSPQFVQALEKLSLHSGFKEFSSSYNIAKILTQVKKEIRDLHKVYLAQFADMLDAQGAPHADKTAEYEAKMEDFLSTKVQINRRKVKVSELMPLHGISPSLISLLEPILEEDVAMDDLPVSLESQKAPQTVS